MANLIWKSNSPSTLNIFVNSHICDAIGWYKHGRFSQKCILYLISVCIQWCLWPTQADYADSQRDYCLQWRNMNGIYLSGHINFSIVLSWSNFCWLHVTYSQLLWKMIVMHCLLFKLACSDCTVLFCLTGFLFPQTTAQIGFLFSFFFYKDKGDIWLWQTSVTDTGQ